MITLLLAVNIAVVQLPPAEVLCGHDSPEYLLIRPGYADQMVVNAVYDISTLTLQVVSWSNLRVFCDGLEKI